MAFEIEFTPDARDHLKGFRKRDQQIILDAIAKKLSHEPDRPTHHRKPLDVNPVAPWELRIGELRVFYDVDQGNRTIIVVAVGRKVHNQLWIGGEEIDL